MGDGKGVVKRCLSTVLRASPRALRLCDLRDLTLFFPSLQNPRSPRPLRTAAECAEKSKCLVSYVLELVETEALPASSSLDRHVLLTLSVRHATRLQTISPLFSPRMLSEP